MTARNSFLYSTSPIVALSVRHMFMYHFNRSISKLFLEHETSATGRAGLHFSDLVTSEDWWAFLENSFLANIQTNADEGTPNKWLLNDNVFLGPPRLRMIRVRANSCKIHPVFQRYFQNCYAEYAESYEDRRESLKGYLYQQYVCF